MGFISVRNAIPPPVVTPPQIDGSPTSSTHTVATQQSTVTAQSQMTTHTAQSQMSQENSDVFPVSENEVVMDLIRQAKDLSRPSLRRKAMCELQERGLYFPDNRGGRTQTLIPPGSQRSHQQSYATSSSPQSRLPDDQWRRNAPCSSGSRLPSGRLFKAAPPGMNLPAQNSPVPIAMDTPRSISSRVSWMSDSASRVSHITDCAALWYRAMGGSVLSGQSPLSSAVSSSWIRLEGTSNLTQHGELYQSEAASDTEEDEMTLICS